MRASVAKHRSVAKWKLKRPHGRSRFTVAEIDAGWAKVRELMRRETALHASAPAN